MINHMLPVKYRYSFFPISLLFSFLVCAILSSGIFAQDNGFPNVEQTFAKTIHVGVRSSSAPFSYKKPTKNDEDILEGYGGYIVEVCRAVLRHVISSGTFTNYHVKAIEVTAENRFKKLVSGDVDMLCGPDSITTARLLDYNFSHPIFLSGIAVAKLPIERLPNNRYCGPIVGVVRGTTSQLAGVKAALDAEVFERFNPAVHRYLALASDTMADLEVKSIATVWNNFSSTFLEEESVQNFTHGGKNGVYPPNLVKTAECPNGFVEGPVVVYENHDDGIADLCAGNIFFYLGDVDIIKRKKPDNCDFDISRQTFTKEAYGIYFRKTSTAKIRSPDPSDFFDAILYSEFNNILLTKMQDSENVLNNQYLAEFGSSRMAEDLKAFFASFQYATNY